jgi:TRAP-type uncharacterized transport system fused permease subunit
MNELFGIGELIALIVFAFSLWFWVTSKQEGCWYRRYVLPLMVGSFALVLPEWWAKIVALISAALIYDGYQGYGREKLAEKEKKK